MAKRLSAPGKTFFVGEYLALVGGPSILVTTAPRFTLRAELADGVSVVDQNFAAASPAGKFLRRYEKDLGDYVFNFDDPHHAAGGLGASSAQWAMLYALKFGLTNDWSSVLEHYRQSAWNGEGVAPSGADVVAQMNGGITWFDGRDFTAKTLDWKFASLSFTLIRTGHKLATHEHLRKHQSAPQEALRACVSGATRAFETGDESVLIDVVNEYARALQASARTAEKTSSLLNNLKREPWVLAAKGCGAMGADVMLVLHDLAGANKATSWAESEGLSVCGRLTELDLGLRFEV